ncbi:MAG TPA: ATP-binding protein [Coleofasciculaceae cyanobacterium]|jgi:PAS domain S-box-containing protein
MTNPLSQKPLSVPLPGNEAERLAALHRYNILDTPPEAGFDRITKLAARLFNMPIALISLVDKSRAWFKSCVGFDANEVPRDNTLCSFAVLADKPLIVPDTRLDDRFVCNPFVQAEPGVRFYAGAPLISQDGFNLGTLCLLDSQPHDPLAPEQQATLVDLAAMVVDELELRLAAQKIAQSEEKYKQAESQLRELYVQLETALAAGAVSTYRWNIPDDRLTVSAALAHLFNVDVAEATTTGLPIEQFTQSIHEEDRPRVTAAIQQAIATGDVYLAEYRVQTVTGEERWVAAQGQVEYDAGSPMVFIGALVDATERKRVEQALRDSEGQSRNILESVTDAFFALDEDWRFTYLNGAAEILLDRTLSDLLGQSMWEVYPGLAGSEFEQLYWRVMRDREAGSVTSFYPDHDRWYEVHGYPAAKGISVYFRNVTEQIESAVILRQSEERYRTLFESIDEGFCVVEVMLDANDTPIDYRILEVNPIFEQQAGLQDAVGKTARQLNLEEHWIEIYGQVALTGESVRFEEGAETLNRWFDVYACRIGEPKERRVALVFKNISDRKRNEDDRKRREANLTFLADIAEDFSRLSSPDEIMQSVGTKIGAYLQITTCLFTDVDEGRGEVTVHYGWNSPDVLSTVGTFRLTEYVSEEFQRASRAGEMVVIRNTQTDPRTDGPSYAALNMYSFVTVPFHRNGKWTQYIAICDSRLRDWRDDELELIQEVSHRIFTRLERARAEALVAEDLQDTQRLRELGERLVIEGDIQTLYQEILTTAIDLTHADAGTVQLFDLATQELILLAAQGFERAMTEYFYRMDASSNTPCGIALKNGDRTFVNFDVPESEDPDGSMRLHIEAGYRSAQSTPLMARSGRPLGMISTHWRKHHQPSERELRFLDLLARQAADLIKQRQITAEREQLLVREQAARAEADRANRIKDEFLAVLSHELRSPLNPILGWTRLLQTGKLDATRQRDALATIERNAKLQTQLIEDLLDISRILQGKLSLTAAPVNLAFVISAALETVRLAAEAKHIQTTLDLEPNIALISGDAARLQQVVWNLLTNAVKFTPQGGQLTIELRQIEQLAQIRVIDRGKGIASDFLPHVFEYFRQQDGSTTRKFGGLGLGLAIVRQIVEMHGGTVWAESRGENQGATFTVQLPVLPQIGSIASEPSSTQTHTEAPLDNVQILLVDDDTDTREFQAFLLEQSGANVTAVASGLEALQLLDQWIPDVMISDVGMAEMDGYMLMEQIRSREALRSNSRPPNRGGTILAIALTAYATEQDRQRALQAGFQVHLTKPLEPEQFISAIVSLLKQT